MRAPSFLVHTRPSPVLPRSSLQLSVVGIASLTGLLGNVEQFALSGAAEVQADYARALLYQPIETKMITCACIYGFGDLVAQWQESSTTRGGDEEEPEDSNSAHQRQQHTEYGRAIRFATVGGWSGLLCHAYYGALDRYLDGMGAEGLQRMAASIAVDQLLWTPVWYAAFYLPLSGALKGNSPRKVFEEVQQRTVPLCLENAKLWLPACLLIYNVPLEYRTLTTNMIDLAWVCILSALSNGQGKAEPQQQQVVTTPAIASVPSTTVQVRRPWLPWNAPMPEL